MHIALDLLSMAVPAGILTNLLLAPLEIFSMYVLSLSYFKYHLESVIFSELLKRL
ncbi:hypothetical protein ENASMM123B_23685 [Enterobacter asburiae]